MGVYTIRQAAKFLGVSPQTLRRWEKQGKIIPQRTLGNARRYSKEMLEEIKNARRYSKAVLEEIKKSSFQKATPLRKYSSSLVIIFIVIFLGVLLIILGLFLSYYFKTSSTLISPIPQ